MAITHRALADQFYRARGEWPFIADVENRFGLPRCLLFAVGSRETNLTNERGDGGHGWGVWQLDDRSHVIPPGYLDDVRQQALDAAAHLAANYARYGDWTAACNAYNSGRPQTSSTTGGNYGPDVMDRAAFFESITSPPPPAPVPAPIPQPDVEDDMQPIAADPETGDFWALTGPDGGIGVYNADGTPGNRFYGNLVDHPQYNAGEGKPLGPAVWIEFWPQGQPNGGYVIFTRAPDGSYHPYHFDEGTSV